MVAHKESSPGKKAGHEGSPGGVGKFVGPGHAETVQASENFDKAGLVAAHLASLHDAYMLERGLLPGTSLPDDEAPLVPPVFPESPWKDLKPATLSDMKVGKTHRRHVLEGRLCVKSLKVTSVVSDSSLRPNSVKVCDLREREGGPGLLRWRADLSDVCDFVQIMSGCKSPCLKVALDLSDLASRLRLCGETKF